VIIQFIQRHGLTVGVLVALRLCFRLALRYAFDDVERRTFLRRVLRDQGGSKEYGR